jgi:peptide deformylase
MAKLPIVVAPDPILKRRCEPMTQVDDAVRRLLDDMLETMYEAPGVGLAAPQVGILRRALVIDCAPKDEPPQPLQLVNPEILWQSDALQMMEEGCLSLPDYYADVERPARVRVGYVDTTGARQEIEAVGLLATCLQHEIDHLDGVLFVDYLSSVRRGMILRKLKKAKRQEAREIA